MTAEQLDPLRVCCDKPKLYFIVYDGGSTPDLPIHVCKDCFENKPQFQQFIKKKTLLQNPESYF